ncbi:hypothetical protein LS77_002465 [Helicobacter bilis]|uniref:YopX protein domain-containing protein n=3 Tax=Helicobacter TaxID=209 RepID=A0A6D2CAC1_9HELI|nr:YopX family protein [Helicobacter bilis]EMZ37751.1 hypothetical protein C826_01831 [Helicobacter bilis WiWa]TLE05052.1 hypothetical protein LS76_006390 [Helicobacter bilis]TLE05794.1 hypothetical protein LS77_002465 [Helicobacter bilis]
MQLKDFDFRIWDKGEETLTYASKDWNLCIGFSNPRQDKWEVESELHAYYDGEPMCPSDCEIELWSGLCDKNGKKIYEGDIVKNRNLDTLLCLFDKHNLRFVFKYINRKEYDICYTAMDILEVIGNIHENAYLLKKRKRLDK